MKSLASFSYRLLKMAGTTPDRPAFLSGVMDELRAESGTVDLRLFFLKGRDCFEYQPQQQEAGNLVHWCRLREPHSYSPDNLFLTDQAWFSSFFATLSSAALDEWAQMTCGEGVILSKAGEEDLEGHIRRTVLIPFEHEPETFAFLVLAYPPLSALPRRMAFYKQVGRVLSESFQQEYVHFALKERVKELSALYRIAQLAAQPQTEDNEILEQITQMLPHAMQCPDHSHARLTVEPNRVFHSYSFQETSHCLMVPLQSGDRVGGRLEVFVGQAGDRNDPPLFLDEERELLEGVARQVMLLLERKEAEDESRELQKQLLHADRLATMGLLSAGVAHEINEPLGSILGFSQLIQESGPGDIIRKDAEKITKATLHAREIVRKLMHFSRQMPLRKSRVQVNQVVEEALAFLQYRFEKENIALVRDYDPSDPSVVADPGQLQQVVVNLAVNSLQAMPDGGEFTIRTRDAGEEVTIQIRDTGSGIAEDLRERIFLPFFTTKDVNEGTGLGLSVVHGIVTSHGGAIDVDSEPDAGTCFTIGLPTGKRGKGVNHESG